MIVSKAIFPENKNLTGNYINLLPLNVNLHSKGLWEEVGKEASFWKYMLSPSFNEYTKFEEFLQTLENSKTNKTYVCILQDKTIGGFLSLININLEHSCAEVGRVLFGNKMQKTTASTESIFLLMKYAFEDLHFRRVEWRCNSLNIPSIKSANRYGFLFEARLRNHIISKGASRDTLIFSMLEDEWNCIKPKFAHWLLPSNFDENGKQKYSLNLNSVTSISN